MSAASGVSAQLTPASTTRRRRLERVLVALHVLLAIGVTHRSWARPGHLVVGLALAGWIVVQVAFLGTVVWLHVVYFLWGVATAAVAVWLLRLPAR